MSCDTSQGIVQKLNRLRGNSSKKETANNNSEINNDYVDELKAKLDIANEHIQNQEDRLARLTDASMVYATLLSYKGERDPNQFCYDDFVVCVDVNHKYFNKVGRICSNNPSVNVDTGTVCVEFYDIETSSKVKVDLGIGLPNFGDPQAMLLVKNDGTNVAVSYDNKIFEVRMPFNSVSFKPGDRVKIHKCNQQIYEILPALPIGQSVDIISYNKEDHTALVSVSGIDKIVMIGDDIDGPCEGDSVLLDQNHVIAIKRTKESRYVVPDRQIGWDDIGGQKEAKNIIREVIEDPYQNKEIYEKYNQESPKGILLYGPPGCGKTLLGKAAASTLATLANKNHVESGFLYVKAPEILNMFVGNSESKVRQIFKQGLRHYEKHGYPCVIFIDEADAILMSRQQTETERWRNSLVAMFLAEMDGIQNNHSIVILATNRPKAIDGAITRDGRIDYHIHVPRPSQDDAFEILRVHLKDMPLNDIEIDEAVAVAIASIFDKDKTIYNISHKNGSHIMSMGDCVNGAFLAGIARKAKQQAIRRDIVEGKFGGVSLDDFLTAVDEQYQSHKNLNLDFEIDDFCEKQNLPRREIQVNKIS